MENGAYVGSFSCEPCTCISIHGGIAARHIRVCMEGKSCNPRRIHVPTTSAIAAVPAAINLVLLLSEGGQDISNFLVGVYDYLHSGQHRF